MKHLAKLFSVVAALFTVQAASAQCPAGQAEVELEFTTDAWGYEVYWEVVPAGNNCGTGTIASGGNTQVGCAPPGGVSSGGYANNDVILENLGCLTIGTDLDLIMTDDYGDGGTSVDLIIDGTNLSTFAAAGGASTHPFSVIVPANNLTMNTIYYNGQTDTTERDVYFYQIPARHAKLDTMYFAGTFTNNGSSDQTNVEFGVDVDGPFTYYESNNIGTLNAGSSATDSLTAPFFAMKQMGTYDFTFWVDSDSLDELPDNNIVEHTIEVTDTVYARDNDNLGIGWATLVEASGNTDALESSYYINADDVASSVSISLWDFGQGAELGAILQLYVSDGNAPIYKSDFHTVVQADLNAALGADHMLTLPLKLDANDQALTGPASIPAGFYTVGVQLWGGQARVGIDPDLEAAPQTQFIHYQGDWYYTTGSIYQMRLNVESDPCNALVLNPSVMDVSCNGLADGEVSLTPAGGTAPYSYNWSDGATTASNAGIVAGDYDVTVTDDAGCEAFGSFEVEEPDVLTVTTSTTDAMCGNDNGTATANVSGGTAPYNYFWDNTDNTASTSGWGAGTHGVTVTDDNGCVAAAGAVVNASNSTITLSVSVTSEDACGYDMGSAVAAATSTGGAVTYMWDNGDATDATTGLAAGVHGVTVMDAAGCSDMASVTITELAPAVVIGITTTDATCGASDGSATVSSSTSYTYAWDDDMMQTTATATGLSAQVYPVVVTDTTTGCMAWENAYVNNPAGSIAVSTTVTDADCYGDASGEVIAAGSISAGPFGYGLYTTDGDSVSSGGAVADYTFTGVPAGEYIVIAGDLAGCLTSTLVTITEPTMLMASAMGTVDVTCNGDSDGEAMVSAMGGTTGYTYMWDNGATTATATGLMAGSADVTVTDANGCEVVETATVGGPSAVALAVSSEDITCNGDGDGSIDVIASGGGVGGYTYAWDNGLSAASSHAGLAANNYNVTVTDGNGCEATGSATIGEPDVLSITANATNDFVCFGDNDGTGTSSVSGGTIPYSFIWSNGGTSANNNSLGAGSHTVMVTDANGCTATSNAISVTEGSSAVQVSFSSTDETCLSCNDGSATATGSGGTAPYTYSWGGGLGSNATVDNLDPNCPNSTYTCMVTDADGCTASGSVDVACGPNAIQEVEGIASMTVYPNPNTGLFNVDLHSNTEAQYAFIVRNVIGQTVVSETETISGNYTKTIDLSNETDGVYFLTVKGADTEKTAKIIVK